MLCAFASEASVGPHLLTTDSLSLPPDGVPLPDLRSSCSSYHWQCFRPLSLLAGRSAPGHYRQGSYKRPTSCPLLLPHFVAVYNSYISSFRWMWRNSYISSFRWMWRHEIRLWIASHATISLVAEYTSRLLVPIVVVMLGIDRFEWTVTIHAVWARGR